MSCMLGSILVLVNRKNFAQSWKLKRAFELLTPRIDSYLTTFADSQLIPISFTHNGTTYTPLADVIFITK